MTDWHKWLGVGSCAECHGKWPFGDAWQQELHQGGMKATSKASTHRSWRLMLSVIALNASNKRGGLR